MSAPAKAFGLLAEFATPAELMQAASQVRAAGFQRWDVFSPYPIHGMDKAMGLRNSKVGWFTFIGGVAGYFTGMLMIWWMNAYDYPLIVGGKPMFSPFSAFPPSYELTILFGAFGTLFGMLYLNRLPRLHHPLLKNGRFTRGASHNRFYLVIECDDPKYADKETRRLLESAGSRAIELVEE